ncbi:single-stranded-DNA-specific exonuclease RecJ, partial [Candidatus Poribacteria bacterium]
MFQRRIWRFKQVDPEVSFRLADRLKISPLLAHLLASRGIRDEESARRFLYPSLDHLHDPFLLPDMDRAVTRILEGLSKGERIWIYGDYDVDGTTAISMLLLFFRRLGVEARYYIPNRLVEGYGLNVDAITEIAEKGCDLLITVDCGISSVEEVEHAKRLGIDVVITDHHHPKGEIPKAHSVVNPKLPGSLYPFKELAGSGVAFKLIQALAKAEGMEEVPEEFLDLVALGTIADVTPLVGENRVLAKFGLEKLSARERVGIRALCDAASLRAEKLNSYHVSFILAPRLNASGRLDTAHSVVELLTTDSYEIARRIAFKLNLDNAERQKIEKRILTQAIDMVNAMDLRREKGIVLASEEWHRGVIGIVASRIVERFYRPTILIALEEDEGHGSGRSIPEFDLFEGISRCEDLLLSFGGHSAAAGIRIRREKIPDFRRRFSEVVAETLSEEDLTPKVEIDLEALLEELTVEMAEEMELLEPFGFGNPSPLFAARNLSIVGLPQLMKNDHLKFKVRDGRASREVVAWNMGRLYTPLSNRNITFDLAFQPRLDEWRGSKRLRLELRDIVIHPSESPPIYPPEGSVGFKIVDRRGIQDKFAYISRLLEREERTLLYVRSARDVERLAEGIEGALLG